jgi:hypothetical protein
MNNHATNSPLLGYNTNVRHLGHLFHIQTEDSGVEHPHVITHLFTDGTILSSKKTSYAELLKNESWEEDVRQLMKNQHKAMFVELRDGIHDETARKILGDSFDQQNSHLSEADTVLEKRSKAGFTVQGDDPISDKQDDTTAEFTQKKSGHAAAKSADPDVVDTAERGTSIFDIPDSTGTFGESLISDKSLDEVILSYLQDEKDD